jgi:prepilin-type N-terminal cleavage/methylation domain-containing protein
MVQINGKKMNNRGFSLIELSLVLVIVGMILSVGVGVMNSLTKKSKLTREKVNLSAIKNSIISYGLSHGRLPVANPPGELPYLELNISSAQKDVWAQPYRYDVTNILTSANPQNYCVIIYQLANLLSINWGNPYGGACNASNIVCVTDTTDASDNGSIASTTQGYYIAAYISSNGADHKAGAKNSTVNREHEMSSNSYDVTMQRDDIVEEISFTDLSNKSCNDQNTTIQVTISGAEGFLNNSGTVPCDPTTGFAVGATVNVHLGQRLYSQPNCANSVSFEDMAKCDAGLAVPNCAAGTSYDGAITLTL